MADSVACSLWSILRNYKNKYAIKMKFRLSGSVRSKGNPLRAPSLVFNERILSSLPVLLTLFVSLTRRPSIKVDFSSPTGIKRISKTAATAKSRQKFAKKSFTAVFDDEESEDVEEAPSGMHVLVIRDRSFNLISSFLRPSFSRLFSSMFIVKFWVHASILLLFFPRN